MDINIYVTNVTKNLYTNLNNLETPEIKLKDAIMASMSIPFLFPPVKIGDSYYIDGCCKNISGSPPLDICILGYSIILSGTNIAYISRVIRSIANNWAPNSLYTITCSGKMSSRDIVNVDSILTHSRILELYKTGIRCSREQINHGTENFKTWE